MGKIPMEKALEAYNTIAAYCRQCESCSDCLFGVYEAEGLESECIITLSPDPPQDWQGLDLDKIQLPVASTQPHQRCTGQ